VKKHLLNLRVYASFQGLVSVGQGPSIDCVDVLVRQAGQKDDFFGVGVACVVSVAVNDSSTKEREGKRGRGKKKDQMITHKY
jgi:hypothetical protein